MKVVVRSKIRELLFGLTLLIASIGPLRRAAATPYASAVTNNSGTVSFTLNESADNVTVVLDNGASTLDLGARDRGRHNFSLGGASIFHIRVTKTASPGWLLGVTNQISYDSNILVRFVNQRGVSVNRNPASPNFGRIYVAVATAGTNTAVSRPLGDGIYVLGADQTDVLAQGNTARTGGLSFTNGGHSENPNRLTVGPDDTLYICDWSDATGTLYLTDPDVTAGQVVLEGLGGPFPITSSRFHGSIAAAYVEGSLAGGNLVAWVIDEDMQVDKDSGSPTQLNSIWRWDIGVGPIPFSSTPPTRIRSPLIGTVSQVADLTRGPDGKFYASQRRANVSTDVYVISADEQTSLWSSLTASRTLSGDSSGPDLLFETRAIDVSKDGKYIAVLRRDNNTIRVAPLLDGLPNLTNLVTLTPSPTTGDSRDIAFDIANNIYAVSSGQGLLRIYSPGGHTIATTGSDGTFTLVQPEQNVSVTATDPSAREGSDNGTFTLTRSGGSQDSELTVQYSLSGTATNGTDYETNVLSVTFPAGINTIEVPINLVDDNDAELVENVTLSLVPTALYGAAPPTSATVTIFDNEQPVLVLTTIDTNVYERLPGDPARFRVTRYGDTNTDIFQVDINAEGGTAIVDVDYYLTTSNVPEAVPPPATANIYFPMPPGVITATVSAYPYNDADIEGDEVIRVVVGTGSFPDYISGSATTAKLQDDDLPPAPILFEDDFDNNTSGNWTVLFGANSGVADSLVDFSFDYSTLSIPSAPHSVGGTTRGVRVQVNKSDTNAFSAGVNLYPVGQNFSGDYALQFDLFLNVGTTATTEHGIAGINHSGTLTNRATQSVDANNTTAGGDGIWIGIVTDASDLRDYAAYTYPTPTGLPTVISNRSASTLTRLISSPPYAAGGSPANTNGSPTRSWADVELRQVAGVVTLTVNNNVILQFANTSGFNSGNIMIGFNDQFDSVGSVNTYAVFDNVRVVNLSSGTTLTITGVQRVGSNVQIDFTSSGGGQAGDFGIDSTPTVSPVAWGPEPGATIVPNGGGFRATVLANGLMRFYRVRH